MADIRLLGSIYVRNKPVQVGKNVSRYKADAPIIIGDTACGLECRWIMANGLFVADQPFLVGMTFRHMRDRISTWGRDADRWFLVPLPADEDGSG